MSSESLVPASIEHGQPLAPISVPLPDSPIPQVFHVVDAVELSELDHLAPKVDHPADLGPNAVDRDLPTAAAVKASSLWDWLYDSYVSTRDSDMAQSVGTTLDIGKKGFKQTYARAQKPMCARLFLRVDIYSNGIITVE